MFRKVVDIDEILGTSVFDLIMLNETKLDDGVPLSFYKHPDYNLIRLDRTRVGGGLLVLIKKNI